MMDMGVNGAGQHLRLNVAAQADVILSALGMGDTDGVLFDDRAFIQIGRHIVRGCPDEFHTAFKRLFVRVLRL